MCVCVCVCVCSILIHVTDSDGGDCSGSGGDGNCSNSSGGGNGGGTSNWGRRRSNIIYLLKLSRNKKSDRVDFIVFQTCLGDFIALTMISFVIEEL